MYMNGLIGHQIIIGSSEHYLLSEHVFYRKHSLGAPPVQCMEISSWLSLNSSFKLRMGENETEANTWLFSSFSKTKKSRENQCHQCHVGLKSS